MDDSIAALIAAANEMLWKRSVHVRSDNGQSGPVGAL